MQEEVIYRCINTACARPMPRPVNFCPWCGTAQREGLAHAAAPAQEAARHDASAAALAANAGAAAAAAMAGWSDAPAAQEAPAAQPRAQAQPQPQPQAQPQPQPQPQPQSQPQARPEAARGFGPPPGANEFGHSAQPQDVPRPAIPARPARRKPVQLRWWILALAILWAVWLLATPSSRKIERRIETAAALARECKGSEAQAELIALRADRATPEQLERLQKTLNDQSAICTTRRLRNKAWSDASMATEAALATGNAERARTRLQGFIRRWGEDDRTRALKARVEEAVEREKHPLAVPRDQAG